MTGLLALLAAGVLVAAVLSLRDEAPAAQASERTVTVAQGVIETIVSGSGNLEASRQSELDFGTSGRLRKLYVQEGQHVSKGELLGRIDDRSQRVAVARAEADLVDAQDALESALDAESNTETATTETVQLRLVSAQVTPTPTPEASPAQTPTPTGTPFAPQPSATPTPTPTATVPSQGQAPSSGGSAPQGSGTGSESTPQGGGSTMSVESAQASVASAELALDDAKDDLQETRLRAPMAGTVASISGAVGDTVGSGSSSASSQASGATTPTGGGDTSTGGSSAFIVLVALSRLKLEVALSEADIGKVEAGQPAKVSINAASGEQVAGEVTKVGVLSSSSTSGSVSYPVTVTLEQSTEGVRAGMSATADIVVDRTSGLTVPSQALRGSTVTVERDGGRATQRVETGVVGESMTEVVSGLEAGDRVIVTSSSALQGAAAGQQTQGAARAGAGAGGFGGGRGGFGGGPPGGGGGFGGGLPGGP